MAITWQAYEYQQPERHPHWFAALWIFALALAAVAVILKSYLLAVFLVLSAGVVNIFALKPPGQFTFSLGGENLTIGDKTHPLKEFTSFWIFERPDGNILSLEGKRFLNAHLHIPLADINPQEVRELLAVNLTESEHEESLLDLLAERLKL